MNATMQYREAVDHLTSFMEQIAQPLWNSPKYPQLASRTELAMAVLKRHPSYSGGMALH